MKKSFVFITILALLFSLIGCSTDNAPLTGSIKVSVNDSTSRTITSDVSPEAVKYTVVGTAPDGSPVSFELSESTPSWTNAEAAPGNWSFTATAYNDDGKAIGDGSSSATVVPGQSTSATIEVNEYSGMGNITVNLTGTNSDRVRYTAAIFKMTDGNMTEVASGEFDAAGIVSFTLPNGFYALVLSCDDASINMPAAEAVRIMKDDNLSVSYSFCNQGGVDVVISNGIKPCPEMSITLSSESINVGEKVTATAYITPGTYNYVWYVNDVMIESVNGNSVDITLADEGVYKITCIAYDTETGVVWSQEATVNVITPRMNTVSFYSGNRLIETRECPSGSTQSFPSIELGNGFTLKGWKAEGSDTLIMGKSFSLPYSENEYKYYAYIETELLWIDYNGAVYGTDSLKNSSTITEVAIPDSIRGKAVTSIGSSAFSNCYKLTSITIPGSVTSVGSSAFWDCSSLTGITIPDSVTSIGEWAFDGCSSLTSFTIPDSVTSIGEGAFEGCSSLTEIHGESFTKDEWRSLSNNASIPYGSTIYLKDGLKDGKIIDGGIIYYVNRNTWERYVVYADRNITTAEIKSVIEGDTVTSIEQYAFYDCDSLTSIIIPGSVTSIGKYAFYNCSSLTSIIIPGSVTSIGYGAFECCSRLTSITIPNSVTSIGECAFLWCSGLTSITVSDNNKYYKSIDGVLFDKDGQTIITYPCGKSSNYYTIPNSVTSIGYRAFWNCSSLTSLTIPESVTSIGYRAFWNCSSLTSITIPDSVTSIGDEVFSGCSSLASVTIGNSVTSIGKSAFRNCSSLTSITIPGSVTSIGEGAFEGCSSLTSITIPDSVTFIGDDAFTWCSGLTSITIPDSVTSIGNDAFYHCSSLTSIAIPDSVTSIGDNAFYGCSGLTSITIPDSVTSIGSDAFRSCSKLTEIHINKPKGALYGSPWGAPKGKSIVKWQGEF